MELTEYAQHLLETRYLKDGEKTWEDLIHRVSRHAAPDDERRRNWYYQTIVEGMFLPSRMPYMATDKPFAASCFVLGPIEDSRESIFSIMRTMAELEAFGGGCGYNFSRLRPNGTPISTTRARASGPVSFMRLYNEVTRTILRGGGKSGAQMGVLDVSHPDIYEFVTMKDSEKSLINFNISVAISDAFMDAVQEDSPWDLAWEGSVWKTISARQLFHDIAEHAWNNGEPGVLFMDEINRHNPFDLPIEASNACVTGETLVAVADGRNAIPIQQLVAEGKDVPVFSQGPDELEVKWARNFRKTRENARIVRVTLDDGSYIRVTPDHKFMLRDGTYWEAQGLLPGDRLMSISGDARSKSNSNNRQVISVQDDGAEDTYNVTVDDNHNLAYITSASGIGENGLPMMSGVVLRNCSEQVMPNNFSCVIGSVDISKCITPTKQLDWNLFNEAIDCGIYFLNDSINHLWLPIPEILDNVLAYRNIGLGIMGFADLLLDMEIPYDSDEAIEAASVIAMGFRRRADEAARRYAKEHGTRVNVTTTSIAPTGSIATLAGCSFSIEPIFGLTFQRNTILGQTTVVSDRFERVARERGFYSEKIMDEVVRTGSAQGIAGIPQDVQDLFKTANEIPWQRHVQMQAEWQRHLDCSIAKTVNLPESATVEDVENVYKTAYASGCKSTTVYRDQSRQVQAITVGTAEKPKSLSEVGLKMHMPDDVTHGENVWAAPPTSTGYPIPVSNDGDSTAAPYCTDCTL